MPIGGLSGGSSCFYENRFIPKSIKSYAFFTGVTFRMIYGNYLIVILGKNIAYLQSLAQTWWIRFRLSPIEVENSHRIKLKNPPLYVSILLYFVK